MNYRLKKNTKAWSKSLGTVPPEWLLDAAPSYTIHSDGTIDVNRVVTNDGIVEFEDTDWVVYASHRESRVVSNDTFIENYTEVLS